MTKVRWVVEAVHGAISQKFRLLDHTLHNKMLPKVRSLCCIAGYLQNTFGQRLISDVKLQERIIRHVENRLNVKNTLAEEVLNKNWNRHKRTFHQLLASEVTDFSELSKEELQVLFTGSYQLTQAVSYLAELIDKENDIQVQYVKEAPNILQMQVRSRHINSKTSLLLMLYTQYNTTSVILSIIRTETAMKIFGDIVVTVPMEIVLLGAVLT